MGNQTYVLRADRLQVSFGGVMALNLDRLELPDSETVSALLMGTNGAGKTTLLDAISGFVATTRGASLELRGTTGDLQLSRASRVARVRAGIVRTFQRPAVFPSLCVADTLAIPGRGVSLRRGRTAYARREHEICSALGILDVLDRPTSSLPLHVLRRVEFARVLATEPRVLFLDEPTAGCDDSERVRLAELLLRTLPKLVARLHADQAYRFPRLTTCAVTHDLKFARQLADTCPELLVHVLRGGKLHTSGALHEVEADAELRATYFGGARA